MGRAEVISVAIFGTLSALILGSVQPAGAQSINPAHDSNQISATPNSGARGPGAVSGLRVGIHPDKTRIVLDLSKPTNMQFDVSTDGRIIFIEIPEAIWEAGAFSKRHARGTLAGFRYDRSEDGGGILSLLMGQSVRIKRPFLVSPSSERGHRVVIDAIAAPKSAPGASKYMLSAIQTEMPKAHPISASTLPVKPIEDGLEPPEVIGIIETAQAQYPPLRQVPRGLDPYQWRPDSQQYQPQRQAPSGLDPYQQPAAQYQPPLMQGQGQGQQAPMTPVQVNRQSYQRPFYARGGAGFSFEREAEISGSSNNNSMEFDLGINLSGALGIDLQNDFRAEAEMIYIHNDVKSIAGIAKSTAINSGNVSGSVASFSTMANLVYDFSGQSSFTPFVFGGVGLSSVGLKDIKGNGTDFYDDSDFVFAMQFGAGVSVPFDERITIEASYRFFDAQDPEIQDAVGNLLTFQSSYHTFMMALRYAL